MHGLSTWTLARIVNIASPREGVRLASAIPLSVRTPFVALMISQESSGGEPSLGPVRWDHARLVLLSAPIRRHRQRLIFLAQSNPRPRNRSDTKRNEGSSKCARKITNRARWTASLTAALRPDRKKAASSSRQNEPFARMFPGTASMRRAKPGDVMALSEHDARALAEIQQPTRRLRKRLTECIKKA